jgi:hypothetical protein
MLTYHINDSGKKRELEIIKQTVYNNKYNITTWNNEIKNKQNCRK